MTEEKVINKTEEQQTVPAEKSSKKKILKKVLISIVAVVLVIVITTSIVTAVGFNSNLKKIENFGKADCEILSLENYADGCWNIHTDKELRVMQLTDVHLGGGWMSISKDLKALNAVAAMIKAENPDFVIVSGDLAYPIYMQAGTTNNKSGSVLFAELMEQLGVYWTMTFGNHDVESNSRYSKEDLIEIYSEYPHCLLQAGPEDIDGKGNQIINIVNSDKIITRSLILLDSHAYAEGHIPVIHSEYDNIHENQIEWYKKTVRDLNEKNEQTMSTLNAAIATKYANEMPEIKTSLFFHIPLTEYADAWKEYADNDFKDTENVKFYYGTLDEEVCCASADDEMFETVIETGSTDSIFCGHDHVNTFSVDYKGVRLTYGMSIDYLAYIGISKEGSQRGCTIITYNPDGTFSCRAENYYQEKYISYYEKEEVKM